MPTSVKDFFERRVPDALNRFPDRAREVSATFLFKIAGADGGTWTADLVSTPAVCHSGIVGQPQCTIEASDEDFRNMIDNGTQAAMQLFLAGRLKISGDPMLITRLLGLLQMGNLPEL